MALLQLDGLELLQRFRRPGGVDFTQFLNTLIRAIAWDHGIPESEISTCSRADARDGGVDTRVGRGDTGDKTGYFGSATIWQFRATDERRISKSVLRKEVRKAHAKGCIEKGDAYRVCVCDDIPDEKKSKLEAALSEAVLELNASSPTPKILTVENVAALANRYPALVMALRPGLPSMCQLFDLWGSNVTNVTPTFVPGSSFEATRSAVATHVSIGIEVPEAVLPIQGFAGVGKTRTAYESLRPFPWAQGVVLYTDDEEGALGLSRLAANDPTARAIILADDCSVAVRYQINNTLRGCRDRVRCVAIDNSGVMINALAPEHALKELTVNELEQILKANFPGIPMDRMRAYSSLAKGFVRLAADMCKYDAQIAAAGGVGPAMSTVRDYFHKRLNHDQRKAVAAVALLKRVGRRGDVEQQLQGLCTLTGLERDWVEEQLDSVKEAPGFVERGARYYRVTPEIIAVVGFELAWRLWAAGKEDSFLLRIPESIQEPFLECVAERASPEVRNTVQAFFRKFAEDFVPEHLEDLHLVNRFVNLIETQPESYLPMLRAVVDSANHEHLTSSPDSVRGMWGPRRQLVWLAERLAQFPEFFDDAEAILYKLAQHESEASIGNNATKIWQQLFRIQLSGTALPLKARLRKLQERCDEADEKAGELIAGALKTILDLHGTRLLGPPVVAGRIPPSEWNPRNPEEFRVAIAEGLVFLRRAEKSGAPSISKAADEAIIVAAELLVRNGWLADVRSALAPADVGEAARAELAGRLKHFIVWSKPADQREPEQNYISELKVWIRELEPQSLHGMLLQEVGCRPWDRYGHEAEWRCSLGALARRLWDDTTAFGAELDWLLSPDAQSGFEFGVAFGQIDNEGRHLDEITRKASEQNLAFPRGYAAGLISGGKFDYSSLNRHVDELERERPVVAFQIALVGGDVLRAFERTVTLVSGGRLPAFHLRNFEFWVGARRVTTGEIATALSLLLPQAKAGDRACRDITVDLLGALLHRGELPGLLSGRPELVWEVLSTATVNPGQESFWWAKVLGAVSDSNPKLAASLACRAMVSGDFHMSDEAKKLVSQFASSYPREVMEEVDSLIRSDATSWRFFISKYPVFLSLPTGVVIEWVDQVGVTAARAMARHVPAPYIDAAGKPALHPLTEYLLTKFEDDDRTFNEFCAGVHTFQMYWGDIAAHREQEAGRAEAFLYHPVRRVREWARLESQSGRRDAKFHRELDDEER